MTPQERLTIALHGGTPDITPLSIYSWMIDDPSSDRWRRVIDQGLILCEHYLAFTMIEHGVEEQYEERTEGGHRYAYHFKKTPVGTLRSGRTDGWHTEYWIKEPNDYKVMQWIVEHTECLPTDADYVRAAEKVGDAGLPVAMISRTPAMLINVDWAGTEQFCMDVALEVPELFDLYEARMKLFKEETAITAQTTGTVVKSFENLTISMMGPDRYRDLLVRAYQEAFPVMREAGKQVFVHYDGALQVIADQIADAPFDGIESLTEPPEGDMTYDQCRAAWPEKVFWANINVDTYALPENQLRAEVIAKRERAGKRGLAFEISEDLPANWEQSVPVVLATLQQLG